MNAQNTHTMYGGRENDKGRKRAEVVRWLYGQVCGHVAIGFGGFVVYNTHGVGTLGVKS